MNKKQLAVLTITFTILANMFMKMSLYWKTICSGYDEVTNSALISCIKAETFANYPYIFSALSTAFSIMLVLEFIQDFMKKDKHKRH